MQDFETAIGYDDISLLPNFSSINSRKDVSTETIIARNIKLKYPLILSPMLHSSTEKACIELNRMGAAGIIHRFMSFNVQLEQIKKVKDESGRSFAAIGLKDYKDRIEEMVKAGVDLLFCDSAVGMNRKIYDLVKFHKTESKYKNIPLVSGNTLTKESVSRLINVGVDGVRHNIGCGGNCSTPIKTGIACPSVSALFFAWKAVRNWELYNNDWEQKNEDRPSILIDGSIRKPSDLCKAIASGADAAICNGIFTGCLENTEPENIEYIDGKAMVKSSGMASKEIVEEFDLSDGSEENLFVEGETFYRPFKNKSVKSVVYEFVNGLKSSMSYLDCHTLNQMRGGLWNGKIKAMRITSNSLYEQFPHGKV